MADRTLNSSRGTTSVKSTHDASLQLDFYLPPPDDRAYRWGKIQHLRDQITAWRRHVKQKGQSAAEEATVALPCWNSSCVSPTRRCLSRHEKSLLHSQVLMNSQRGNTSSGSQDKLKSKCSYPFNNSIVSNVTEVPYFHDYINFCLPKKDDSATADVADAEERKKGLPEFCYAVTTCREGAARQGIASEEWHQLQTASREPSICSIPKVGNIPHNPAQSTNVTTLGIPGVRDFSTSEFIATKTQCFELATSVHRELVRDFSVSQHSQEGQLRRHVFNETMEVPIDWGEFGRVPSRNTALSSLLSSRGNGTPVVPGASTTRHCADPNVNASLFRAVATPSSLLAADGGRRPLRLYTIRLAKKLSNSTGSMEKREEPPRFGFRIKVPETWPNS